jgi:hypothetical protein
VNFQLFGVFQELGLFNRPGESAYDRFEPLKGLGYLGLPRPELAHVGIFNSFQTRVFMLFNEFNRVRDRVAELAPELANDPRFAGEPARAALVVEFLKSNAELTALVSEFHADPRVTALNGRMVSTGSGGTAFDESRLAAWYLWCANEFGL